MKYLLYLVFLVSCSQTKQISNPYWNIDKAYNYCQNYCAAQSTYMRSVSLNSCICYDGR